MDIAHASAASERAEGQGKREGRWTYLWRDRAGERAGGSAWSFLSMQAGSAGGRSRLTTKPIGDRSTDLTREDWWQIDRQGHHWSRFTEELIAIVARWTEKPIVVVEIVRKLPTNAYVCVYTYIYIYTRIYVY